MSVTASSDDVLEETYLLEANLISAFAEALTADVEAVLADNTSLVSTDSAV